jgi:hypothetical protein
MAAAIRMTARTRIGIEMGDLRLRRAAVLGGTWLSAGTPSLGGGGGQWACSRVVTALLLSDT